MKKISTVAIFVYLVVPYVVFADMTWVTELIDQFGDVVNVFTRVLVGVALLLFLWGMVRFIANSGDEKAVEEGKKMMVWGVFALFVIVSVWGLVGLLREMSDATGTSAPTVPEVENPF